MFSAFVPLPDAKMAIRDCFMVRDQPAKNEKNSGSGKFVVKLFHLPKKGQAQDTQKHNEFTKAAQPRKIFSCVGANESEQ